MSTQPIDYQVPNWPGFYTPQFGRNDLASAKLLYDAYCKLSLLNLQLHPSQRATTSTTLTTQRNNKIAIWRFTLLWTLLFYGTVFFFASLLLLPPFLSRHPRLTLIAPLIAVAFGLALATFTATIIGFAIAAVYSAVDLPMSTFVPALYSLAAVIGLIMSSFTTVRGML